MRCKLSVVMSRTRKHNSTLFHSVCLFGAFEIFEYCSIIQLAPVYTYMHIRNCKENLGFDCVAEMYAMVNTFVELFARNTTIDQALTSAPLSSSAKHLSMLTTNLI